MARRIGRCAVPPPTIRAVVPDWHFERLARRHESSPSTTCLDCRR